MSEEQGQYQTQPPETMGPAFKPILCVGFDGVLSEATSDWNGADVIPDEPVPGAIAFLMDAVERFRVCIFSSRSCQPGGVAAMQRWLLDHGLEWSSYLKIEWPQEKPPAMVTLDDRAIRFTGEFPSMESLQAFKPWNRREG